MRVMTTKDSKGFFPSCDPLFATLTAAVLERDIVIVQAEAELYASVSTNFTICRIFVLSKTILFLTLSSLQFPPSYLFDTMNCKT